MRDWLSGAVPAWSDFQIADTVKYLGFWPGPVVTTECFTAPLEKFLIRTCRIARSMLAPTSAVKYYNSRATTVLGYVSQLALLGPLLVLEAWAGSKILRMPGSTMSADLAARIQ